MYTPYNDHTRRAVQHALARAEADATRRQPGLVQRNWDLESDTVTIDHDTTAADLKTRLFDLGHGDVTLKDARDAVAYALAGNTDAVLI